MSEEITRVERGWGGHFICAEECRFRRNTLVSYGDRHIVVSTVGAYYRLEVMEQIGADRYYETMAFVATQQGLYLDADVTREVKLDGQGAIVANSPEELPAGADNIANAIHEEDVQLVLDSFDSLYKAVQDESISEIDTIPET